MMDNLGKDRIARAWTMYLRAKKRNDQECAQAWMDEWTRLCNRVIAKTVVDDKEWML